MSTRTGVWIPNSHVNAGGHGILLETPAVRRKSQGISRARWLASLAETEGSGCSERSCLTHGKLAGHGGGSAIKSLAHPSLAAWVQSLRSIVEGER